MNYFRTITRFNSIKKNRSLLTSLILANAIVFLFSIDVAKAAQSPDLEVAIDNFWVLFCALLVLFNNGGFALLESGFCRAKNTVNVLFKNLLVPAIATVCFFTLGFAIAYGNGNSIIGTTGFFLTGADNSPAIGLEYQGDYSALSWASISLSAKFLYQVAFAATAATIISGAVAERIKLISYLAFCVILTSFIYPLVVHWTWGFGFLHQWGFYDFGGSTIVHSVGGWCALAGCILLGERKEKYHNGQPVALVGHNLPLSTLGCFILWLGWFGLNAGSSLSLNLEISEIALNTLLSSCAGAIAATILSWILFTKPDLSLAINGVLAGLVAITAGVNCIDRPIALLVGTIAGFLVVISILMLDRLRIDDPVGAISVHLINGVWGTIAVGLFANPAIYRGQQLNHFGLFYGGNGTQLIEQLFGIFAVGVTVLLLSTIAWKSIDLIFGLRVSLAAEFEGLDRSEHSMVAYVVDRPQSNNSVVDRPQSNNSVVDRDNNDKTIVI